MKKKIEFENLIAISKLNERKINRVSNLSLLEGEIALLVNEGNNDIYRCSKVNDKYKFVGNAFYTQSEKKVINLLNKSSKHVSFLEDSQVFKIKDDRTVLDYFLNSVSSQEFLIKDVNRWTQLTINHRKLFSKKYISLAKELTTEISNINLRYQQIMDKLKSGITSKLSIEDFDAITNSLVTTRYNGLIALIKNISGYWLFYEKIKKASNDNYSVLSFEKVEKLKEDLDQVIVDSKITHQYKEQTQEIKVIKEKHQEIKTNYLNIRKQNFILFKKLSTFLKNNYKSYFVLFKESGRITHLKYCLVYKQFRKLINKWKFKFRYLNQKNFEDLKNNISDYINEFVNNNLYSVQRNIITKKFIKNIIDEEFEFTLFRTYFSISENNYKDLVGEIKDASKKLRKIKSKKVIKYEETSIFKEKQIETIEYELNKEIFDVDWKKQFLKSTNYDSKSDNDSYKDIRSKLNEFNDFNKQTFRYHKKILRMYSEYQMEIPNLEKNIKLLKRYNKLFTIFANVNITCRFFFGLQKRSINKSKNKHLIITRKLLLTSLKMNLKFDDLISSFDELSSINLEKIAFIDKQLKRSFLFVAKDYSLRFKTEEAQELLRRINTIIKQNKQSFLLVDKLTKYIGPFADKLFISYENKAIELGAFNKIISHPIHPYSKFILTGITIPEDVIHKKELSNEISYIHKYKDDHWVFGTLDQFVNWSQLDPLKVPNYIQKEIMLLGYADKQKTQMIDLINPNTFEETMMIDVS